MPFDPDPIIHQTTRLRIIGALYRNRRLAYTTLRQELGLTDGNLGAHLERLIDAGYVHQRASFGASGLRHVYEITDQGVQAFEGYVAQIEAFLRRHTDDS